ncbi:MAG: adenosylcobinamide-GDP ribazoletransferase [Hyphomicrobiales bacterium]|nr:adenosylcobinamide-GDP ribazoletransferase [Hyphomicrobiales bacterium]
MLQPAVAQWLQELRHAVAFYTLIPAHWMGTVVSEREPVPMGQAMRMVPLAGALVGAVGAAICALAAALTGSTLVASVSAVAATMMITGALHEDGLADTADALAGTTPEKRLEILHDSHIGNFGAAALCTSILLRVALIAVIAQVDGIAATALVLIAAHAVSRGFALWLPYCLPPARKSGAAVAFGRPSERVFVEVILISLVIAFITAASVAHIVATVVAVLVSALVVLGATWLAERLFGGQTGDLSGATQQLAEIAFLFGFTALIGL